MTNDLFKTEPNNFDDKLFSQERTVIVNIKKHGELYLFT